MDGLHVGPKYILALSLLVSKEKDLSILGGSKLFGQNSEAP